MTKFLSASLLVFFSCGAWAGPVVSEGPGPVATYANCKGILKDGTDVEFQIRATAAYGVTDAVLLRSRDHSLIDQLLCESGEKKASNVPSIIWSCTEYKTDHLGISVELMSGGVVGRTTGQIKQKQSSDLQSKVIGSLFCD